MGFFSFYPERKSSYIFPFAIISLKKECLFSNSM